MKHLPSVFMPRVALWLLKSYHRVALDRLGIEAAVWYVRGLDLEQIQRNAAVTLQQPQRDAGHED